MIENYLIEAEELNEIIDHEDVIVVDTRDPSVFQKGHLPGAVNIPEIFTYLCLSENGGYEALQRNFAGLFGKAGVKGADHVIVYEDAMDNGYGQSCRGWYLFNLLGHSGQVQVLHGGLRAWLAKKLPLSTEFARRPAQDYAGQFNPNLVVTNQQMLDALHDPAIAIVDVRDYAEWIGANSSPYGYDFCPRKGRIPNARWLEWYRLMRHKSGIPWIRTREEILDICDDLEITPATRVYVYCFKGARTSNTMLALKMAGIRDVRNYFMSWNEWSRDASLPIQEGYPDS